VIKGEINTPNESTAMALTCKKNLFLFPLLIKILLTTVFLFFSKIFEKKNTLSFVYEERNNKNDANSLRKYLRLSTSGFLNLLELGFDRPLPTEELPLNRDISIT
jgi:hypothetical protein